MDIRQFRAELAQAFEEAGFERRSTPRCNDPNWLLPGREVDRVFGQHAIRRPWGFLLSGSLAVEVPAFRAWLNKNFPPEEQGILRGCLLARHIANERDMFFGVEVGQPPYDDWVRLIRTRLAALPDTIEGLLDAEHQPERLKFVWHDWLAPKAFGYFRAWESNEAPANPPPYRLPDGRIVDAAANDLR